VREDLIPLWRHRHRHLDVNATGNLTLDELGPTPPIGENAADFHTSPRPEGRRRRGRPPALPVETRAPPFASLNSSWARKFERRGERELAEVGEGRWRRGYKADEEKGSQS
jgi:hypothetical protein